MDSVSKYCSVSTDSSVPFERDMFVRLFMSSFGSGTRDKLPFMEGARALRSSKRFSAQKNRP